MENTNINTGAGQTNIGSPTFGTPILSSPNIHTSRSNEINIYSYRSNEIGKIVEALSNAQGCMRAVKKNKHVNFQTKQGRTIKYSYADLAGVIEAVRTPFKENGLATTFRMSGNVLQGILAHKSGQWFSSDYALHIENDGSKNHNQCFASAITYGKRYLLSALAGISDCDDDDGESSVSVEYKPQNNPPPPEPKPKPIVTKEETLRREMNKIYKDFKQNLESAETIEQKSAYRYTSQIAELFKYAASKPILKVMLDELLVSHGFELEEAAVDEQQ